MPLTARRRQFRATEEQLLDFDYYMRKTFLKTSALICYSWYLLLDACTVCLSVSDWHSRSRCCSRCSALLAEYDESTVHAAQEFGKHLGLAFQLMDDDGAPLRPGLEFPLVVKPAHEGSGMGVTDDSLVRDEPSLRREVARLVEHYEQPALVERYLPGREITVGMIGNPRGEPLSDGPWSDLSARGGVRILPLYEVLLHGGLYTDVVKNHWEGEWLQGRHYACPAPMDDGLRRKIEDLAVATFRATGLRDVARVDLRIDEHGEPMVLEINALPGLSPGWSDLTLEAASAGISYDALVLGIARSAVSRPA